MKASCNSVLSFPELRNLIWVHICSYFKVLTQIGRKCILFYGCGALFSFYYTSQASVVCILLFLLIQYVFVTCLYWHSQFWFVLFNGCIVFHHIIMPHFITHCPVNGHLFSDFYFSKCCCSNHFFYLSASTFVWIHIYFYWVLSWVYFIFNRPCTKLPSNRSVLPIFHNLISL